MKNFSSLQEMWDYFSYCPMCKSIERKVDLSIGPEFKVSLRLFDKQKEFLILHIVKNPLSAPVEEAFIKINCQNNTFSPISRLPTNLYCYIQSKCFKCKNSAIFSEDMELDNLSRKITGLSVESEVFELRGKEEHISIDIEHFSNDMHIFLHEEDFDNLSPSSIFDDDINKYLPIKLPFMKLDFSDIEKLITKIKTLILFS